VKTSHLIDVLSRGAGVAPRGVVGRRLGLALAIGLAVSAGVSVLGLGVNPDLPGMGAALALKLAYVAGLTASAAWLAARLACPGAPWLRAAATVILVIAGMCVPALIAWMRAGAAQHGELLFGQSWASCPWRVAALSSPALLMGFWAIRGLAPTRLRLAGAAAGLTAGGLGAFGYTLHCPEVSPVFVLTWYTLGMLVPAAAGALLGPRLLRW
jgi:hypothetical protein